MHTLSISSLPLLTAPKPPLPLSLGFGFFKTLRSPITLAPYPFRLFFKSPTSLLPEELSGADEDDDEDEDEDIAAEEYDEEVSDQFSYRVEQSEEDEAETSTDEASDAHSMFEQSKAQRVEQLCSEIKQFGADLMDVDELASIYDFRIDKFQVLNWGIFIY